MSVRTNNLMKKSNHGGSQNLQTKLPLDIGTSGDIIWRQVFCHLAHMKQEANGQTTTSSQSLNAKCQMPILNS